MRPNLTFVTDHLAIGGSFPADLVPHLAGDLRIRAVVDLRRECCDDAIWLDAHGLAFLHLPTLDHHAVDAAMLDEGVAFARVRLERGERVLVHCEHGIGRSATLALCILVDGGTPPLDALELAKSRRSLVSPSPAQYHAWIDWLGRRPEAGRDWELPGFAAFAAIAYCHLREA